MKEFNIISSKAEINAMLDKIGREFRIPTCPEPIKIENPHAVIEIKEKPIHEPTAQELMEMIQHDRIGKIHVGEYQSEREALIAIYEAANGKRWHNNTNWCKDDKPVSEWYGVTVSPEYVFFHEGKIKKLMGHVTQPQQYLLWQAGGQRPHLPAHQGPHQTSVPQPRLQLYPWPYS